MKILLCGGSGFLGQALFARFSRDGHTVTVLARSPDAVRALLGPATRTAPLGLHEEDLAGALADTDALVNVAGEPIPLRRWTPARKERLSASRVGLTGWLVDALRQATHRPAVFVSASAVGLYGDRGDDLLTEASPPGKGFLADLCHRWEEAAQLAAPLGVRVVCGRMGPILGRNGGLLAAMVRPFSWGFGTVLGGDQLLPWIHLDDVVSFYARAIEDPTFEGPYNVVAPEPVTMSEFSTTLGRVLHRPVLGRIPAGLVRLTLGEAAEFPLGSQRAVPKRLEAQGFTWRNPRLPETLEDLLSPS